MKQNIPDCRSITDRPAYRRLRAYAFDPSLSIQLDHAIINDITYKVEWEELSPGPVGDYLEIVDYDPSSNAFYKPVNLDDHFILAKDGLDPDEGNPQFHQQMVYAVAMTRAKNLMEPSSGPHREIDKICPAITNVSACITRSKCLL
jgi:hypothetical protein